MPCTRCGASPFNGPVNVVRTLCQMCEHELANQSPPHPGITIIDSTFRRCAYCGVPLTPDDPPGKFCVLCARTTTARHFPQPTATCATCAHYLHTPDADRHPHVGCDIGPYGLPIRHACRLNPQPVAVAPDHTCGQYAAGQPKEITS